MLKKLGIGTILFIGSAIFITLYDDKKAAKYAAQEPPHSYERASTGIACEKESYSNIKKAEWHPPGWHSIFAWPNGVTAWGSLATLWFIAVQAQETAKAAEASRKSVEVQEADFYQWLDIGDFSIERDSFTAWENEAREFKPVATYTGGKTEVRISFSLTNNTSRQLCIRDVRTNLAIGTERKYSAFVTEEALWVPPKNEYRVVIDTVLDEANSQSYYYVRVAD